MSWPSEKQSRESKSDDQGWLPSGGGPKKGCGPRGKILETTGKVHEGTTGLYRASTHDRQACPSRPQCCPNMPARKIPRDVQMPFAGLSSIPSSTLIPLEEVERNERSSPLRDPVAQSDLCCPVCGTAMAPKRPAWWHVCPSCGMQTSTLEPVFDDRPMAEMFDWEQRNAAFAGLSRLCSAWRWMHPLCVPKT